MRCYSPLTLYRSRSKPYQYRFNVPLSADWEEMQVACKQCINCRINRKSDWAVRLVHETLSHDTAIFVTLTFNEEALLARHQPDNLSRTEVQKFVKRLRRHYAYRAQGKIRYYYCGEYGDRTSRPHYHILLFGASFDDEYGYTTGYNGLRRSDTLEKIWGYGMAPFADVTYKTAAYVAGYCMKKVNGRAAKEHYAHVDRYTGEVYYREPEFSRMSTNPGIGYQFFHRYHGDLFPKDFVTVEGRKRKIPSYYYRKLEARFPSLYLEVKEAREEKLELTLYEEALKSVEEKRTELEKLKQLAIHRNHLYQERKRATGVI